MATLLAACDSKISLITGATPLFTDEAANTGAATPPINKTTTIAPPLDEGDYFSARLSLSQRKESLTSRLSFREGTQGCQR
jgi:hypothetical protein